MSTVTSAPEESECRRPVPLRHGAKQPILHGRCPDSRTGQRRRCRLAGSDFGHFGGVARRRSVGPCGKAIGQRRSARARVVRAAKLSPSPRRQRSRCVGHPLGGLLSRIGQPPNDRCGRDRVGRRRIGPMPTDDVGDAGSLTSILPSRRSRVFTAPSFPPSVCSLFSQFAVGGSRSPSPCPVTMAVPTPRATANPPIRPI